MKHPVLKYLGNALFQINLCLSSKNRQQYDVYEHSIVMHYQKELLKLNKYYSYLFRSYSLARVFQLCRSLFYLKLFLLLLSVQ